MRQSTQQRIIFTLLFAFLGFLAFQVPVARLVGSRATFTLFDAFAPTAGAFLGALPGVAAVFLMQAVNFAVKGFPIHDVGVLIRFVPPLFATAYFASRKKSMLVVPLLAMFAFNLHPVGRSVWYFSLYWLVPIVCYPLHRRSLLARSLGATFTAHAVGGALWMYTVQLPASAWVGLIPVVALERTFFALGMACSYVLLNNAAHVLSRQRFPSLRQLSLDRRYLWRQRDAFTG